MTVTMVHERAEEISAGALAEIQRNADRFFSKLLLLQWVIAVGVALFISPRTWIGNNWDVHVHVYASLAAGVVISLFPFLLAKYRPGATSTRHVIAASQVLWSALFIHLSGGRIETHFHVFISLVILSLYRDHWVLLQATAVVAVDHLARGIWWPESVFGIFDESPFRWIEHAAWVLVEVGFLYLAIRRALSEMFEVATHRAKLEGESQQSQDVIRAFYDSTPLFMGVVDVLEDDIIHVSDNPTTAAAYNSTPAEIAGKSAIELGRPREEIERWIEYYRESRLAGKPCTFDVVGDSDGERRWLQATITFLGIGPRNLPRHSYVVQDVTVLHQQMAQLEEAREIAESASVAKGEFLANMSHELRTPLTAILGFTDVIVDAESREEDRDDAARTVKRHGEHLLQLINDILDLSKLEAGRVEMEVRPLSPVAVIEDVRSLMAVRAEEKGLELSWELKQRVPEAIESDPTRLRQILVNLVGNATKFTSEGTVRIELGYDEESNALSFAVHDEGIGMTDEQVRTIFEPFTQADSSMTRRFGGTGLGLSISLELARLLGGDVSAECTLGEGCVFTVTITPEVPEGTGWVEPDEAVEHARTTLQEETRELQIVQSAGKAGALEGIRILFAEDGVDNQRLVKHILSKAGAKVDLVENGALAVEAAQSEEQQGTPYDVILMDMQMPVLDGEAATKQLRAAGYAHPIIALTAHAMEHERQRCIDAGCNAVEAKPIDRKSLFATLERARSGRLTSA